MSATRWIALVLATAVLAADAEAADLRVMRMGLGSGTVTSAAAGINCGSDCDETYATPVSVTLTATPGAAAAFARWEGDCAGTAATCTVTMTADRSVRAVFDLGTPIPTLTDLTPAGIEAYLTAHPEVNSAARFVKALPPEFKQNWILMPRSESLQTGTAEFPRILLPSANAEAVFTLGVAAHASYPGAHPDAVEYMQWDAAAKNFRFHEIAVAPIPAMGSVPPRSRGVSVDDEKCSRCHSTRNVLNRGTTPGTDGVPPGTVQTKNKPNWDAYDSWGGMAPFNRDRIYQGSVEAAAFRKIFDPWTWRTNDAVRSVIEQLELQPAGVPAAHAITRTVGGTFDGHVDFGFDVSPPVLTEPAPSGTDPVVTTNYGFDGSAGTGTPSSVVRGGAFVTLHHSDIATSDEGRGVRFFDSLGGLAGSLPGHTPLNQRRIADELVHHRFATGSVPIDVRPIALAITSGCLTINTAANRVESTPPLTVDLPFFDARNGQGINEIVADTTDRARSMPRRKADIERFTLDRTDDKYQLPLTPPINGLVQEYGAATSGSTSTALPRLRQEVFRRPIDLGFPDGTVMGGIYVDRELATNFQKVALYRYFLEPLGVSVDKWSMGVRGRSRTYSFADVFGTYLNELSTQLQASLTSDPVPGLSPPFACADLVAAVNTTLSALPPADAVPTFTDVQRIFNKSCIECHGGLGYPPYANYGTSLDLSEDDSPPPGDRRLTRSYDKAVARITTDPATSFLYQRITDTSEDCPFGMMPCGGPPLSKADVETIRRWIVGLPVHPSTEGDPHIRTVDGVDYDFQAAGEFVLLRGEALEIQARQTPVQTEAPLGPNGHTGLTSCVSLNTAVAVRVGSHRVTYQPGLNGEGDPEGLELRVDGKRTRVGAAGVALGSGGRIVRTPAPGGIQIEAPGGTVVAITPGWWDYYRVWYMNVNARHVRASQGVMGAIAPGSWLPRLPDGTSLGPRPAALSQRYDDLYGRFGNAWRVNAATSLFDYAAGVSTDSFTLESWPAGESPQSCALPLQGTGEFEVPLLGVGERDKVPLPTLAPEVAEEHCAEVVDEARKSNCVHDVMATGAAVFAETYLHTEEIERNEVPVAPVLVQPAAFATAVATPVTFTWEATTDPDGDPLTYLHCVWSGDEDFDINRCTAVPIRAATWGGGASCAPVVLVVGCLLLAVLFAFGLRRRPGLLALLAAAVLLVAVLAYHYSGPGVAPSTRADLEPGQVYSWKVVAEDGQGGTVESEIRRFEVK